MMRAVAMSLYSELGSGMASLTPTHPTLSFASSWAWAVYSWMSLSLEPSFLLSEGRSSEAGPGAGAAWRADTNR